MGEREGKSQSENEREGKGIQVRRRAGMKIKVDWARVSGEKEKFQKEKGYREFGN